MVKPGTAIPTVGLLADVAECRLMPVTERHMGSTTDLYAVFAQATQMEDKFQTVRCACVLKLRNERPSVAIESKQTVSMETRVCTLYKNK